MRKKPAPIIYWQKGGKPIEQGSEYLTVGEFVLNLEFSATVGLGIETDGAMHPWELHRVVLYESRSRSQKLF